MLRICSDDSPAARTLGYSAARRKIRHGDLLLFRHRSLPGRLIAAVGRSPYSHAALAGWWQGRLMVLEVRQFRGGRAVLFSNLLRRGPIDVFATDAEGRGFDRRRAVGHMLGYTGRAYGWRALLRCALAHAPLLRWCVRPMHDEADAPADATGPGDLPPFCSMAVAAAIRAGGVDPVPHLADRWTEPGDLARSRFFRYRFTVAPNSPTDRPATLQNAGTPAAGGSVLAPMFRTVRTFPRSL